MCASFDLVRVGVLGYLDVVDERVPLFPIPNVEDGIVDDLRGRVDMDGGVGGEEAAVGDVVRCARAGEVGVVEVVAGEWCHVKEG